MARNTAAKVKEAQTLLDMEAVATVAMAHATATEEKVASLEAEAQEAIQASQRADASMAQGQFHQLAEGMRALERCFREFWELTGLGEVELPPRCDCPPDELYLLTRMEILGDRLGGSTVPSGGSSRIAPERWPQRQCNSHCRACGPASPIFPWRRRWRASSRGTSTRRVPGSLPWQGAWSTPSLQRLLAALLLGTKPTRRPNPRTRRRGRTLAHRALF